MTRAGDDAQRKLCGGTSSLRGRAALMTCAGDDVQRSGGEERRP